MTDETPREFSNEDDDEKPVLKEEVDAAVSSEAETEAVVDTIDGQNEENLSEEVADQ